jgi:hypothetical protein
MLLKSSIAKLAPLSKSDARDKLPRAGQEDHAGACGRPQKSFRPTIAAVMWFAASSIREAMIPDAGHWRMEQQPEAAVTAARAFLNATPQ